MNMTLKSHFLYNKTMKYVIFDFNGTVLDDTMVCLEAENETIRHFGLDREPLALEEYKRIFTFPVKNYYEAVGFDWSKNSYEEVGAFWFSCYRRFRNDYTVHEGVIDILKENHRKGYQNILLSASSKVELLKQLDELGIRDYFDEVLGIDNIYAESKTNVALNWIRDKDPEECLMIGDTLHDLDTAREMKVRCILVANGHQAKEILLKETDDVVDDIREITL